MYYPKSQIIPNLYSNGELAYKATLEPYTGFYFKVINGRQFTGKFPGDGKNLELITSDNTRFISPEDLEGNTIIDSRFFPGNSDYAIQKKTKYGKNLTNYPIEYFPFLTEDDYTIGEFTRFFSKKVNENIYY